ncbi:MAG: hypothetical protein WAO35_00555 [Terriglobia bacterium]
MTPILPLRISEQDALAKADYFVDVRLWPLHTDLNPSLWLSNFLESEKEHAVHPLNGFIYFSTELIDQMFRSAFQALSSSMHSRGDSFLSFQGKWRLFVESIIVTYVTGETPNPSDSGLTFARKARQVLGIGETRIMSPSDALRSLIVRAAPVLFVDDFVGSGSQFFSTWRRQIEVSPGTEVSFERLSTVRGTEFYYCPLICTSYGYDNIKRVCPGVHVKPAHVVSDRYSALSPDSTIWPLHLRDTAVEFLRTASHRAGIPDSNGGARDWRGFHKLGLALALGDSVPDATMPIFYWEENGWNPLIRRK